MEMPNENWIIANILGILIWLGMFVMYDIVLKLPIHISWYMAAAVFYFIIAVIDFYIHHAKSIEEEKKTIGGQVRDTMGSIGTGALLLMMFGAYQLYQKRKDAQQIKLVFSSLRAPVDKNMKLNK